MSAPASDSFATASATGFADGLGRRTLVFDRQCGGMLERLWVRPEVAAYENALAECVSCAARLDDERFARVRGTLRDTASHALVVVSEFVAGERLSDLLESAALRARDDSAAPGIDVALGFLLQVLPALGALHTTAGLAHGALAPARTLLTPRGQIVLTDYVFARVLQRLQFSRARLWQEFGLAMPQSAGPARFDAAADLGQAALGAVMLALGRPLRAEDFPNRLRALLMEVAEIAQIRANATFADSLRRLLERMLPLPGRRAFGSADEAWAQLVRIVRAAIGEEACLNALPVFAAEFAPPEPEAAAPPESAMPELRDALPAFAAEPVAPATEAVARSESATAETIAVETRLAIDVEPPRLEVAGYETAEGPQVGAHPIDPLEESIVSVAATAEAAISERTAQGEPPPAAKSLPARTREDASVAALDPIPASEPEPPPLSKTDPKPQRPEPVTPPRPDARPGSRRRRGRGVRDRLRSFRTPPPVLDSQVTTPARTPTPVGFAPPVPILPSPQPVGFAPPAPIVVAPAPAPPPPPRPLPVDPPSPYVQALRTESWRPSPVTIPLAPPAMPLTPAVPPAAPAIAVKPAMAHVPQPSPAPALRLKPDPPRVAVKHEPRVERLDNYPATGIFGSRGADEHPRSPQRLAVAAVVVIAAGSIGAWTLFGGRMPSAEKPPSATAAPAPAPAPAPAKTGTLVLETEPAGARVLLDGAAAGETPLTITDVPAGRHVLTFVTSSATVKRSVRLEAGKTLAVDVPVYAGWVSIYAPIVLHVSEAGRTIGTTEQGRLMLSPGRHELTLSNREFSYTSSQIVEIEPGLEQTLNVDPKSPISLNAVPWAEVFLDGQRVGETPIANVQVPLGTREFVFKHPQYGERRITTTVTGGSPGTLSVDFTK